MFRDGQYLEVIKASDNCLATAVVTVQEKTMEIEKRRVSTNKWLDLEDWAALYKILEKAILRNVQTDGLRRDFENKRKKSIRQLEVTYTFEPSECTKDVTSLPTIRVNVSPAKKKSRKILPEGTSENGGTRDRTSKKSRSRAFDHAHGQDGGGALPKRLETNDAAGASSDTRDDRGKRYLQLESSENGALEEYVPDAPTTKKLCTHLKYVPSRKSTLERIQVTSNEYSPTISNDKSAASVVRYIPNSVDSTKVSYETYEPHATSIVNLPEEYVPNSKGAKVSFEEYQPDFTSKSMQFDNSYVPSSVQLINRNAKQPAERHKKLQSEKHPARQKETLTKKNMDLFI